MQHCIAIDWLQIFCFVPTELFSRSGKYEVKQTSTRTRHFSTVFSILETQTQDEVAVLAAFPYEGSVIEKQSGILKIVNKYLYQSNLKKFVIDLMQDLKLGFKSITRLDIALDFQEFKNGLTGDIFIKRFLGGNIIKKGRSTMWKTSGKTPNQSEKNEGKKISYEYLSFGKETSECSYKLYNKCQEMRDVKTKNWILEQWKINGYSELQQDVWRLEFSLKNKNKQRINEEAEVFNFKSLDILDPEKYTQLWFQLLHDKMKFYNNIGKLRKDRNIEIELFEPFKPNIITVDVSDKKETGRSQKIFAKKLMELNQDLRGDDYALGIFSKDLFQYYIQAYSLESWAKKKGYNIEKSTLPEWKQYAIDQEKRKEENQSNIFIQSIQPFLQQNLYNQLPF